MDDAELRLRPAVDADAYTLWLWANDPDTRRASYGRSVIPWRDHVAWLGSRLAVSGAVLLMAESGERQPVGTVRFESPDDWATTRLSYVVAPEARGQGFARLMVRAAVAWLRERWPDVAIEADVMDDNVRSLEVFRRLGWRATDRPDGQVRFHLP